MKTTILALASCLALVAAGARAAPTPEAVTPELVEAAKKEGKIVFYTSIDLAVAEKIGKAFEAVYPGVAVTVERSGAERNFQRLAQERGSQIYAADVVESSDATHFIVWKREGWLETFMPKEVADKWPSDQRDPDGMFATVRFTLSPIGYNTKQVKAEDAPKSFADLLDKKWTGKIVKAHPGYSGAIMTSTFEIARDLGWDYLQKLGKQRVMQVQSATEPPKKLSLGERPVMADGVEYLLVSYKANGSPVEVVYPAEGTPSIPGSSGIFKNAPHPNAAKLFQSYLYSREAQQMLVDTMGMRSFHPDVTAKAGVKPLGEIKLMKADPAAQEKAVEEIKQKYAQYFGV